MRIDVVSDVICPWCFIGKRRLAAALKKRPEVEAEILWHPFQLNPDMPPEGMARDRYIAAKFGGGQHASRIYQNVTDVGATVGIPFHFERIQVTPNTRDAHRLIRRASEAGDADRRGGGALQRLFHRGPQHRRPRDPGGDRAKRPVSTARRPRASSRAPTAPRRCSPRT